MPLTRVDLRAGKTPEYKQAILDEIYEAMRSTFNVPEDDRFMMVHEHDSGEFAFGQTYMGIDRSQDIIIVQITCTRGRSIEMKKNLYSTLTQRLGIRPGIRPEDVFINILEVEKENWSFGRGLAQLA